MIAGIFHEGSGLGDQLFRYITVRTLAEEKGYEWGMITGGWDAKKYIESGDGIQGGKFKGDFFINFDYGQKAWLVGSDSWNEKDVRENGTDIRSYDPEINFVEDNTIIDGSFEDSKYWGHNLSNIAKWLAVEPLTVPDDTCVIGFRGGEYKAVLELFLPKSYYFRGVEIMKQRGVVNFEVHTDDPATAREFFPDFKVIDNQPISHSKHSNMGYNWRAMRYAKHAIIPNSAFFILPRLLAHYERYIQPYSHLEGIEGAVTVAPRYWARRNTKVWARPACFYKQFTYI